MITESGLNSMGFFKVKEEGTDSWYSYQQYTLVFNSVSERVKVDYTAGSSVANSIFLSIINSDSELSTYLKKNNVIT